MTAIQNAYWNLQEERRANRAKERELERSNRAREIETVRSNQEQEKLKKEANEVAERSSKRSFWSSLANTAAKVGTEVAKMRANKQASIISAAKIISTFLA